MSADERPTHADYLAMAHCDLRIALAELAAAEAEVEKARIETEWHPEWLEVLERAAARVEHELLAVKEAERQLPDGDLANTLLVETIPAVEALADALRAIVFQANQGKIFERDAVITEARSALSRYETGSTEANCI